MFDNFKNICKRLLAVVLCVCVISNAPCFRRDVQAFVDPVTVSIVASFLVSVLLTAAGIYTKEYLNSEEGQQFCQDCANWISEKHSEFNDMVDSICLNPSDVLLGNYPQAAWQFLVPAAQYPTITNWILEYIKEVQPQLFFDYDYISGTDTADNIAQYFYDLCCDYVVMHTPYNPESCNFCKLTGVSSQSFINYKFIKFYAYADGTAGLHKDHAPSSNSIDIAVLVYNPDGSYSVFSGWMYYNSSDSSLHCHSFYSRLNGDNLSDDVYSKKFSNGASDKICLNDLQEVAFYVNSDYADETSSEFIGPVPYTFLTLDDDNAITNPDYITNVVNNYSTVVEGCNNDEAVIPLNYPVYADTHNIISGSLNGLRAIDVLDGSSATGIQQGVLENGTSIPDSLIGSDSVLDWLSDWCLNFFPRLGICLKSLFVISEDFLPAWFDKFDSAFKLKGYDFNFAYLNSSEESHLPDIYITWEGIRILFMPSDYFYAASEYVRPFIRAFIYFMILLHDRKRFIYIIRGSTPPDTEMDVLPKK